MADITTKEIKGVSVKNIVGLLTAVILIEFTVITKISSVNQDVKSNYDRINRLEIQVAKDVDYINSLITRITVLESEKK